MKEEQQLLDEMLEAGVKLRQISFRNKDLEAAYEYEKESHKDQEQAIANSFNQDSDDESSQKKKKKKRRASKINPNHIGKIVDQIDYLRSMQDELSILMRREWVPHRLVGRNIRGQDVNHHWSLQISGNWRLTYYFDKENDCIILIDYLDYH